MRKIAILGFLFLLVAVAEKVNYQNLEVCKGFEDTSSLNPRFKIKGIWAWDNWHLKNFKSAIHHRDLKKVFKLNTITLQMRLDILSLKV